MLIAKAVPRRNLESQVFQRFFNQKEEVFLTLFCLEKFVTWSLASIFKASLFWNVGCWKCLPSNDFRRHILTQGQKFQVHQISFKISLKLTATVKSQRHNFGGPKVLQMVGIWWSLPNSYDYYYEKGYSQKYHKVFLCSKFFFNFYYFKK